jgi:hypothetical protein
MTPLTTVDLSNDAARTVVVPAWLLLQDRKEVSQAVADAVAAEAVRTGLARVEVEHVGRAGDRERARCAGITVEFDASEVLVGLMSTCSPEMREYHGLPAR